MLGLLFAVAGASAFVASPPHLPGSAGTFNDVFSQSHWSLSLGAAQFAIGSAYEAGLIEWVHIPVQVALPIETLFRADVDFSRSRRCALIRTYSRCLRKQIREVM